MSMCSVSEKKREMCVNKLRQILVLHMQCIMPKRLTRGKERLHDRNDLKSESSNFFPSGIACCKDLVLSSSCCSKRQLKHISEGKGVLKLA
jgi:hypothetical protein